MTGRRGRGLAALLLAAALAGTGSAAAQQVGVTAAVNPASFGQRPQQSLRMLVLGEDVIFHERILTHEKGLVQVLLVDGSTFTVGANVDLVIDEFVYDPATAEGRLLAEYSRGALRFVGGKLSKPGNTVEIRTPAGTLGIRGGIVNLQSNPDCESDDPTCVLGIYSFVFGQSLTFVPNAGPTRTIRQPGYSFIVDGDPDNPTVEIRKTQAEFASEIQDALSSRPGQTGGAEMIPTAVEVERSGIGEINSALPPRVVLPVPKPRVVTSTYAPRDDDPTDVGIADTAALVETTLIEPGTSDALTDEIATERPPTPPQPPLPDQARLITTPPQYNAFGGTLLVTEPGRLDIIGGDSANDRIIDAAFSSDGSSVTFTFDNGSVTLPVPAAPGAFDVGPVASPFGQAVGQGFKGFGDFLGYYLQPNTPNGDLDAHYFLTGTETNFVQAFDAISGSTPRLRTYELAGDPQKAARNISSSLFMLNPLIAQAFGAALPNAAETPFLVAEFPRATGEFGGLALYAGLLISGQGVNQRSAVNVLAGEMAGIPALADPLGNVTGLRRGSYRLSATQSSGHLFGNVEGLTGLAGGGVFGPDGAHFVLTSNFDENGDVFRDVGAGPDSGLVGEEAASSVIEVATLTDKQRMPATRRPNQVLNGYAAGMVTPDPAQGIAPVAYRSVLPGDVLVDFNGDERTIGGLLRIYDIQQTDPQVDFYQFAFGTDVTGTISNAATDRGTYIDTDTFAAVEAGSPDGDVSTTFLVDDTGARVPVRGGTEPGTYLVSADTVPQDGLFPAGVTPCECRFLEWGWWGTRVENDGAAFAGGTRASNVHLGTFVAGTPTPDAELPMFGEATYTGHAAGDVTRVTAAGDTAQYVAVGRLDMTYSFPTRTGLLQISNFDGRNFSGEMAGSAAGGGANFFAGPLAGSGLTGSASGSLVSGIRGVMGSFDVMDAGSYRASGIFAGDRVP